MGIRERALQKKEEELTQREEAVQNYNKLLRELETRQHQLLISEEDLTIKTRSVSVSPSHIAFYPYVSCEWFQIAAREEAVEKRERAQLKRRALQGLQQ